MLKLHLLDAVVLQDSEMLEVMGGTSDNLVCGNNCGMNCGTNCGTNCGVNCSGDGGKTPPPTVTPGNGNSGGGTGGTITPVNPGGLQKQKDPTKL